jgi:hypothetical protein
MRRSRRPRQSEVWQRTGFTDHVFGLMHLLGFKFAPRIPDLADKRLFVPGKQAGYPALATLIGGTINVKHIRTHWDEILRLATSIRQGTVTASLMLRKLGSYPRQNGLAVALRELGRIEGACLLWIGCKTSSCAAASMPGLTRAKLAMRWPGPYFSTVSARCATAALENQRYRPQFGDRRDCIVEYGLSGTGDPSHQGLWRDRG